MSLCNICKPMYPVSVGKEDPNVPIKPYLSSHYIVDPDTHEPDRPLFWNHFFKPHFVRYNSFKPQLF